MAEFHKISDGQDRITTSIERFIGHSRCTCLVFGRMPIESHVSGFHMFKIRDIQDGCTVQVSESLTVQVVIDNAKKVIIDLLNGIFRVVFDHHFS